MSSTNPQWRRSSACNSDGCVEVAHVGDMVQVRDSKLGEQSPVAPFTAAEWSTLTRDPQLLWIALSVAGLRFTSSEMVVFEYGLAARDPWLVSA